MNGWEGRAQRFAKRARAGTVWINTYCNARNVSVRALPGE
jgi:acyl-CoA reductase-like NAD-dependent aldehyde dehydrogenase